MPLAVLPAIALPGIALPGIALPGIALSGIALPAIALAALGWCGPASPTPPSPPAPPSTAGMPANGWAAPIGPPTNVLRPFAPPPPGAPWLPGHRGVDLAVAPGQGVRADGAGVVAFAGPVAGTPVVVVDHGGGLRSTFEPLDATVRVGAQVRAGDVLGRAGEWSPPAVGGARVAGGALVRGHCSASCIHWGMLRNRVYVDPLAVTGLRAGCLVVRLLPVDGPDAEVPDLAGWSAAGGVTSSGEPGAVPATGSASGGRAAAGTVAVATESAVVMAGAAVAVGVTVRRRRRALLPPPGAP